MKFKVLSLRVLLYSALLCYKNHVFLNQMGKLVLNKTEFIRCDCHYGLVTLCMLLTCMW